MEFLGIFTMCFLSMFSLYRTRSPVTVTYDDYRDVCPYSTFCTFGPQQKLESNTSYVPCCIHCSCLPDCADYGNCCPDAHNQNGVQERFSCVTAGEYLNNGTYRYTGTKVKYKIVDTCSPFNKNTYLAERCAHRKFLSDRIIVSSKNTQKVYANKYCALCNAESDFIPWNMHIFCLQDGFYEKQYKTFADRDAAVLNNCLLDATPTEPMFKHSIDCLQDKHVLFNRCNKTGNWTLYDPTIEQACLNAPRLYVYQVIYKRVLVFSNVYCFLCNIPHHYSSSGMCNVDTLLPNGYRTPPSFLTFLDLSQELRVSVGMCKTYEILDKYTGECKELLCPPDRIPSNGECPRAFSGAGSISVEIVFSIQFSSTILYSEYVLHQTLRDRMKKELSMWKMHCKYCETSLYTDDSNFSRRYLFVVFEITETCKYESLVEVMKTLLFSPVHATLKNNFFESQLTISPIIKQFPKNLTRVLHELGEPPDKHLNCRVPVRLDLALMEVVICPALRVPRTQLESYHLDSSVIHRLNRKLFPSRYNAEIEGNSTDKTDFVTMCVDEYAGLLHNALQTSGTGIVSLREHFFNILSLGVLMTTYLLS